MDQSVEYQVRDGRLTDIDQVSDLIQRSDSSWTADGLSVAADLLRQLLYMPSASVFVALDGRQVVGAAVLSLRPSVTARGLVGTVDLLVVEPGRELGGPAEPLLAEVVRSARNKGCGVVESAPPAEPALLAQMERFGFAEGETRLRLPLHGRVSARATGAAT